MLKALKGLGYDLMHLVYPNVCIGCGQTVPDDDVLCVTCYLSMPHTHFQLQPQNEVMKRLSARVRIRAAAALWFYRDGDIMHHIIHALKYKGRKDVGEKLGAMMARLIVDQQSIFQDIEAIVPVPLHWKRVKKRGYNQCDYLCKSLSEILNIPWQADLLQRERYNISQTKQSRWRRIENVQGLFSVSNKFDLAGRHLLLVDDVFTTGATSEAVITELLKAGAEVSFLAAAAADKK